MLKALSIAAVLLLTANTAQADEHREVPGTRLSSIVASGTAPAADGIAACA